MHTLRGLLHGVGHIRKVGSVPVARARHRYTILGYLSTAAKHGHNKIAALRDALTGRLWMPALPAPT